MAFLFRLMLYLLLSIPFGVLSWLFVDFSQRLAHSIPVWRLPASDLFHTMLSLSALLPWIVAAAVIASIEANHSRSIALTALATTMFWGGAMVFSTGATFLPSGLNRFTGPGPDGLPYQITRFLPDWLSPAGMFGHHAMSAPGMWQISGLFALLIMLGMIMMFVVAGILIVAMLQRRTA
jgi:hypothetical protein